MPKRKGFLDKIRGTSKKQLKAEISELQDKVEYQAYTTMDILRATSTTDNSSGGNEYVDKKTTVNEIYTRFQNAAVWGCQITQRVINQRRALVIPYGIKAIPSDMAIKNKTSFDDELDYINRFIDYNNLQRGREDDLCRYAEMEGQMLVTLVMKEGGDDSDLPKMIRKSWETLNYTVHPTENDPDEIDYITWTQNNDPVTLRNGDAAIPFVFVAFNDVDFVGMPAVGYILNECSNLHKALIGWRKMNAMFAKVTPFFQADSWEEAKSIMEWMQKNGWKVGTGAAGRDFKMVTPQNAPAQMIYDEIKTNAQIISGSTGLPIHHLGFADVLANRATATTLSEPMEIVMLTDMNKWNGFYENLFDKAIELRNTQMNGKLKTGLVKPQFLPITDRQYQKLVDFWLPAAEKGLVSTELFVEQIPMIDSAEELERLRKDFSSQNKRQLESLFGEEELDRQLYEAEPQSKSNSSDE